MAEALLDKSLDALIAERSTKRPPGGGRPKPTSRGGNRAKAKAAGAEGGRPALAAKLQAKPAGSTAPKASTALRVQSRKIAKPITGGRGRGGSRRAAPMFVPAPGGFTAPPGWIQIPPGMMPAPHLVAGGAMMVPAPGLVPVPQPDTSNYTYRDPDSDPKWKHDMYDGPLPRSRRAAPFRPSAPRHGSIADRITRPAPATVVGTKLHVSNLAEAVTEEDIKELFADKGQLLKAELVFDRSGRATGEAYVTYKNRGDALEAIKAFNGVLLDGLELKIEEVQPQEVTRLASGLSLTRFEDDASRPARGVAGPGRLLGQALKPSQSTYPRGMGDSDPAPRRGPGPGPRVRSSTVRSGVVRSGVTADDMQE